MPSIAIAPSGSGHSHHFNGTANASAQPQRPELLASDGLYSEVPGLDFVLRMSGWVTIKGRRPIAMIGRLSREGFDLSGSKIM